MSEMIRDQLLDDEIEVAPTKSLFVDMLTRDIGINRAVIDLVDNCIDGAKRLRPASDQELDGLWIKIDLDADAFRISDNCGGIDIDLARRYAFRIGRPKDMPKTPNSVGQFGVGMKRALFKFGRYFEVVSKTQDERFRLTVDVDAWEADEHWRFKLDEVEKGLSIPLEDTGTQITVSRLRNNVATAFRLENFKKQLGSEIESAQQTYIDRGLRIIFRGKTLLASPWCLNAGSGIVPGRIDESMNEEHREPILLRLFAGVSASNPREAGWYVFCNGRMVLEADQTPATGWTSAAESRDVAIPKYHNQYARFRGYAFFDCSDASRLPWNTTKTGVDGDSPVYKHALQKMIEVMRPPLTFLNELDAENDNPVEDQPLTRAMEVSRPVMLRDIEVGQFSKPRRDARASPPMVNISYRRERDKIDDLRTALSAGSAKEVGEQSFDLAYRRFVEEVAEKIARDA